MDQLTRPRRPLIVGVAVLVGLSSAIGGCETGGVPVSAPPLLGRATTAPDRCPPELSLDLVRPLSRQSLQWMGEPVLACGPFAEDEVYRFVAQSSDRSSSPLSVRVSRIEGQTLLVARQYAWTSTPDSAQPLSVVTSKIRPVPTPEWEALTGALRSAGFWDMPVEEAGAASEGVVVWDLEGRLGGGYHYVERRPSTDGPFHEIVRHVLTLAGYDDRLAN